MPWRVNCRRMVEHVCSVFCIGSENWSWSQKTLDRIEGWETKAMRRSCRFKKKEDETLTGSCQRTAKGGWNDLDRDEAAPCEVIAESMWRAMGWACDPKPKCGF